MRHFVLLLTNHAAQKERKRERQRQRERVTILWLVPFYSLAQVCTSSMQPPKTQIYPSKSIWPEQKHIHTPKQTNNLHTHTHKVCACMRSFPPALSSFPVFSPSAAFAKKVSEDMGTNFMSQTSVGSHSDKWHSVILGCSQQVWDDLEVEQCEKKSHSVITAVV